MAADELPDGAGPAVRRPVIRAAKGARAPFHDRRVDGRRPVVANELEMPLIEVQPRLEGLAREGPRRNAAPRLAPGEEIRARNGARGFEIRCAQARRRQRRLDLGDDGRQRKRELVRRRARLRARARHDHVDHADHLDSRAAPLELERDRVSDEPAHRPPEQPVRSIRPDALDERGGTDGHRLERGVFVRCLVKRA